MSVYLYSFHIKNSVCVFLCGADSFKSPKYDCKFQHFAVIIRNMTATFNILQLDFEICNHVAATFEM